MMDINIKATAKRWAKANGYHGAQGGWIYTDKYKPVTQGWSAFHHHFRRLIDADIEAGKFKPSYRKRKP